MKLFQSSLGRKKRTETLANYSLREDALASASVLVVNGSLDEAYFMQKDEHVDIKNLRDAILGRATLVYYFFSIFGFVLIPFLKFVG